LKAGGTNLTTLTKIFVSLDPLPSSTAAVVNPEAVSSVAGTFFQNGFFLPGTPLITSHTTLDEVLHWVALYLYAPLDADAASLDDPQILEARKHARARLAAKWGLSSATTNKTASGGTSGGEHIAVFNAEAGAAGAPANECATAAPAESPTSAPEVPSCVVIPPVDARPYGTGTLAQVHFVWTGVRPASLNREAAAAQQHGGRGAGASHPAGRGGRGGGGRGTSFGGSSSSVAETATTEAAPLAVVEPELIVTPLAHAWEVFEWARPGVRECILKYGALPCPGWEDVTHAFARANVLPGGAEDDATSGPAAAAADRAPEAAAPVDDGLAAPRKKKPLKEVVGERVSVRRTARLEMIWNAARVPPGATIVLSPLALAGEVAKFDFGLL
jgi:hypothetical protein